MLSVPLFLVVIITAAAAQIPDAGRREFDSRCARCHGADATGGESGPGILTQIAARSDAQLAAFIRQGSPAKGMPAFALADAEMNELVPFLRSLAPISRNAPPVLARRTVQTADGKTIVDRFMPQ